MTQAMMGCCGRYLLSRRAVVPDSDTVTMAAAFTSRAVRQAAWAVASDTLILPGLESIMRPRRWKPSCSVRSAMADMVFRASTGYAPAAVSPESMIAEVPS